MKKPFLFLALAGLLAAAAIGQDIETVTPRQAFERLQVPGTFLVDVRSVAEYVLVGHPPMAWNVPFAFWSETEAGFTVPNDDFVKDLKARFKPEDTLVFICRAGGRSLRAARAALAAGFPKVVNLGEGFEGGVDDKGLRTVGGWRNSGLPFTYDIDPQKAYAPGK
jgi:rhodanese-related sulfurtransferase